MMIGATLLLRGAAAAAATRAAPTAAAAAAAAAAPALAAAAAAAARGYATAAVAAPRTVITTTPTPTAPRRSVTTTTAIAAAAGAGDEGDGRFSAEQVEQLKRVTEGLRGKLEKDAAEMKAAYGEQFADKVWQFDYYRHRASKFLPAAAVAACKDEKMRLPSMAAKQVAFFAQVLRDLPPDTFNAYAAVLPLLLSDLHFLLAVLHATGTPAAKAAFGRLTAAIRRGGDADVKEAAGHIAAVPVVPADEWPIPYEDPSFADGFKTKVYPYEVVPSFARAKDMLSLAEYMVLATTTVLEAQWAGFYATGDARYVRKVLRLAQAWSDFMYLPDHTDYWLSLEKKLPDDIMVRCGGGAGGEGGGGGAGGGGGVWGVSGTRAPDQRSPPPPPPPPATPAEYRQGRPRRCVTQRARAAVARCHLVHHCALAPPPGYVAATCCLDCMPHPRQPLHPSPNPSPTLQSWWRRPRARLRRCRTTLWRRRCGTASARRRRCATRTRRGSGWRCCRRCWPSAAGWQSTRRWTARRWARGGAK